MHALRMFWVFESEEVASVKPIGWNFSFVSSTAAKARTENVLLAYLNIALNMGAAFDQITSSIINPRPLQPARNKEDLTSMSFPASPAK